MDAVDSDVHQSAVGKLRVECIFNDSFLKLIVSRGIFRILEAGPPDRPHHRKHLSQLQKSFLMDRTHGFHKNCAVLSRNPDQFLKLRLIRGYGLLAEHMFSMGQHQRRLFVMKAVRAGDVDRIYILRFRNLH